MLFFLFSCFCFFPFSIRILPFFLPSNDMSSFWVFYFLPDICLASPHHSTVNIIILMIFKGSESSSVSFVRSKSQVFRTFTEEKNTIRKERCKRKCPRHRLEFSIFMKHYCCVRKYQNELLLSIIPTRARHFLSSVPLANSVSGRKKMLFNSVNSASIIIVIWINYL